MLDRMRWETHQEVPILVTDFSNVTLDEALELLDLLETEIFSYCAVRDDKRIKLVLIMTHASTGYAAIDRTRDLVKRSEASGIHQTVAMVGLSKLMHLLVNKISKDVYSARDITDAVQWLLSSGNKNKSA